jgi:integrase
MLSKEEVKEYRTVQLWLAKVRRSRRGSEKTQAMYAKVLPKFCEFCGMDPDQLIAESKDERGMTQGERKANAWFDYMTKDDRYSRMYAKTFYGIVRSFYRANEILFVDRTPCAKPRTHYVIPSPAMLKKAWQLADFMTRMRVGILNDTGMRPEDACKLTYGDIEASFRENKDRIYIEKVNEKEGVDFRVCLSRPVTELVYAHIRERVAKGEKMAKDTLLMKREHTRKGERSRPITGSALWKNVRDFGATVGVEMSPKTFRKRFRTQGSPEVGQDMICVMGGWKIAGVGNNYFLPNEEQIRALYPKLEEVLCLEETRDRDMEVQRETARQLLKAAGLDPDALLRVACIGNKIEDETAFLNKALVDTLRRGNGDPAKEIGAMIADAIRYAKEATKTQ